MLPLPAIGVFLWTRRDVRVLLYIVRCMRVLRPSESGSGCPVRTRRRVPAGFRLQIAGGMRNRRSRLLLHTLRRLRLSRAPRHLSRREVADQSTRLIEFADDQAVALAPPRHGREHFETCPVVIAHVE
jgi:hypothetical protein